MQHAAWEIWFACVFYVISNSKLVAENGHVIIWWPMGKFGDLTVQWFLVSQPGRQRVENGTPRAILI